jgi:hypothetical protein
MEVYLEHIQDTLTSHEITILTDYVKNYEYVSQIITVAINNIKKGEPLDLHFIPEMISIVLNIFKNTQIINEFKDPENIILLIRFNLIYMIESKIIPMPDFEVFVFESIINSSLDLLSTNILPIEKEVETICSQLFNYCHN